VRRCGAIVSRGAAVWPRASHPDWRQVPAPPCRLLWTRHELLPTPCLQPQIHAERTRPSLRTGC
jgi:hypothetical protein